MEEEVMIDKELLKVFMFSCCEAGISEPQLNSVLPEVHKILANKMIHIYGNELLENCQLSGWKRCWGFRVRGSSNAPRHSKSYCCNFYLY